MKMTMNRLRHFLLYIALLLSAASAQLAAQDIQVSVSPTAQIMPPQLGLYYTSPEKYFTVTLTNTGVEDEQVYLGLQIEQIDPVSGLTFNANHRRQPMRPFVVPKNGSYQLTLSDMKHLFDHIPEKEISAPGEYFSNFRDGSYGLLPEGLYELHMTAYRWDPERVGAAALRTEPEVVSNPNGGDAVFRVCYKVQPPKFTAPTSTALNGDLESVEFDCATPIIWAPPYNSCNPLTGQYKYDFRLVQLMDNQQVDVAMTHNPVVYQRTDLAQAQVLLPILEQAKLVPGSTYVAQVTAKSSMTSAFDYVMLENQGKSDYLLFKFPEAKKDTVKTEEKEDTKKDSTEVKPKNHYDGDFILGGVEYTDVVDSVAEYTFRTAVIRQPLFLENDGARKLFIENDIPVQWNRAWHVGGSGTEPDTIQISYKVEMYKSDEYLSKAELLATTPIYTKDIKTELSDTIKWDKVKDKLTPGCYAAIRVLPVVDKGKSVAFSGKDSLNFVDFAMAEHVIKKYFECSSTTEIKSREATTLKADDLKGKTIGMGEYELTIDEISEAAGGKGFKGKGRVEWNPFGAEIMLCVEFDTLQINKELIAYGGIAKTTTAPTMTGADIVNEIFEDWGLDNMMANSSIPYADQITKGGKDALGKALQSKTEIGQYYAAIKQGKGLFNLIKDGKLDNVHTPIGLADVIANESPVDIQIANMTFAPTWATMNIIGEFSLPESEYYNNDVLMFGAPRICISPERVLPESGTLALLADFTVTDPRSDFDITFKAPEDLLQPINGCYVSWHDDSFEMLGIDVNMTIPELVKDVNGVPSPTKERPQIRFTASIGNEWDDWMVDNISMDPFQHEDLPGYTFTAQNIVYDHSKHRNSAKMGAFPVGYMPSQKVRANDMAWMGFYLSEISVCFPKGLEFGTEGDRRLALAIKKLFIDDSGITFDFEGDDVLSAKTGKAGGWAFSLDQVGIRVIQNNFDQCFFNGKLEVPLLDGQIGYRCNIVRMMDGQKPSGDYAYIFLTQQVDSLSMDLFLADVKFSKEQTYFLVEAVPNSQHELETRVELLMSGELSIGTSIKSSVQEAVSKLPFPIEIPDVHFTKMRLANCRPWESQFDFVQKLKHEEHKVENVKYTICNDSTYALASDKLFFSRGAWSLASLEKKFGPFKLGLKDYNLGMSDCTTDKGVKGKTIDLFLEGEIGLLDTLLTASAGFTIKTEIVGYNEILSNFDFDKLSFKYKETLFDKFSVVSNLPGLEIGGSLAIIRPEDGKPDRGFDGELYFKLPGDLFHAEAKGGIFTREGEAPDNYKWGYFIMSVGGQAFTIPPVTLSNVEAGFYFNCRPVTKQQNGVAVIDRSKTPTPENKTIGVLAGLSVSLEGDALVKGTMTLSMIYQDTHIRKDENGRSTTVPGRFTTIRLDGDVHALGTPANPDDGLINAKATIVYENTDEDRYFQLNITADASVDASNELFEKFTGIDPNQFTQEYEEMLDQFDSKEDPESSNSSDDSTKQNKKAIKAEAGFHVSFDLKVELPMNMIDNGKVRSSKNCKWHLYVGEPGTTEDDRNDKRCSITFIDYQLGDKDDPIAVWGKQYADCYLCIGNELPNDGKLPPIPSVITQFLDGTDLNGDPQGLSTEALDKATAVINTMKLKGGVMFGASIEGSFGCNAVIAYCDVDAIAGFDLVLKKVAGGCDNRPGLIGKNGWYGMGQIYAYVHGEIGLMLNLWIFKGKAPICDMGVGLLMQGGFPNPSWLYGKARAKCKLFGGLIKFNKSITINAGQMCTPDKANPLEDVEVFGETLPEYDNKEEGWDRSNAVSAYTKPRFSTNMKIDTDLRLISPDDDSEDANLTARTYRFSLGGGRIERYNLQGRYETHSAVTYYSTDNDMENWTISTSRLDPEKNYMVRVTAYAQEFAMQRDGRYRWGDPWFEERDEDGYMQRYQKPWNDACEFYFTTDKLPDHLTDDDILAAFPGTTTLDGTGEDSYHSTKLFKNEAIFPYIVLTGSRQDLLDTDYESQLIMRMEKKVDGQWQYFGEELFEENSAGFLPGSNKCYRWEARDYDRLTSTFGKSNVCVGGFDAFSYSGKEPKYGDKYRLTFYILDLAKYRNYLDNSKTKEKTTKSNSLTTREKNSYERQLAKAQSESGTMTEQYVSNVTHHISGGIKVMSVEVISDDAYNIDAAIKGMEAEDRLEEAEDTKSESSQYFTFDENYDFAKQLYQKEFTIAFDYNNLNHYLSSIYNRYGADEVSQHLLQSPREFVCELETVDIPAPDFSSDGWRDFPSSAYANALINPYTWMIYWATFGTVGGIYLPAYKYNSNAVTTEGLKIKLGLTGASKFPYDGGWYSANLLTAMRTNANPSTQFTTSESYLKSIYHSIVPGNVYDYGVPMSNPYQEKSWYDYGFYTLHDRTKAVLANDAEMAASIQGRMKTFENIIQMGSNDKERTAAAKMISDYGNISICNSDYRILNDSYVPGHQIPLIGAIYEKNETVRNASYGILYENGYNNTQKDLPRATYAATVLGQLLNANLYPFNKDYYLNHVKSITYRIAVPHVINYSTSKAKLTYYHTEVEKGKSVNVVETQSDSYLLKFNYPFK